MSPRNPVSSQQPTPQPAPDAAALQQLESCVKAALAIHGYFFSEERIADVVQHFTRIGQPSHTVCKTDALPDKDDASM